MIIQTTTYFISPATGQLITQTIYHTLSNPATVLVGVSSKIVIN